MGLKVDDKAPVFCVISRLTKQKGLDLVLEALPGLLAQGGQLVLLGQGDAATAQGFLAAAGRTSRKCRRADWLSRSISAPHCGWRGRHCGAESL